MESQEQLDEIYRLTRENNRMLHAMRRSAWLGSIIKVLVYAAAIVLPLWFYQQYMATTVDAMLKTVSEVQGTSAEAQAQLGGLQDALKKASSYLPLPSGN